MDNTHPRDLDDRALLVRREIRIFCAVKHSRVTMPQDECGCPREVLLAGRGRRTFSSVAVAPVNVVGQYQLFRVWVVFFKLTDCYKMASRLIHNRPGPVRCENGTGPLRRSSGP
jgi:hypothetical protein